MPIWGYAAVPWYADQSAYDLFRQRAIDREDFFDSYRDWVTAAVEHENRAAENGVPIIRICLDWHEYSEWCTATGHQNDAAGRSEFADAKAVTLLTSVENPTE